MANKFSKWIARRVLPSLVKTDCNSKKAKDISGTDKLVKFIYQNRKPLLKKYDITFEELKEVVEKQQQIKKGFMSKLALNNTRNSIRRAIKEGRIKYLGYDSIDYIDKYGKQFHYTFDEMATRIVDNVGRRAEMVTYLGITDLDIRNIVEEEFNKLKS